MPGFECFFLVPDILFQQVAAYDQCSFISAASDQLDIIE